MKTEKNSGSFDPEKQEEIRAHYDEDYYKPLLEGYLNKDSFTRYRQKMVFEIYNPGTNERVLDLGCGVGTFTLELAQRGVDVVGLDYSEESINICKKLAEQLNVQPGFQLADVTDTKFDDDSFDVIIAADLTEHLYPDIFKMFVKESKRILRQNGKLLIWTPNPGHIIEFFKQRDLIFKRDEGHVGYKTLNELKEGLMAEGFKIERAYHRRSHLPVFSLVERLTQRALPFMRRRNAVLAIK